MKNFLVTNIWKDWTFFHPVTKKVVGKIKDVFEGKINDKFVGLKSKMDSKKNTDVNESNTTKGVNIATEFNDLKDTLLNTKVVRHKMKRIQSKKHKIATYEIKKISLSCFDDKRFVLDDVIHTLAYFHKDLKKTRLTQMIINKKRF